MRQTQGCSLEQIVKLQLPRIRRGLRDDAEERQVISLGLPATGPRAIVQRSAAQLRPHPSHPDIDIANCDVKNAAYFWANRSQYAISSVLSPSSARVTQYCTTLAQRIRKSRSFGWHLVRWLAATIESHFCT